jgi:hypothetical protein
LPKYQPTKLKGGVGENAAALSLAASPPTLMADLALRWLVTTFFGASVAAYVYILATQHGRWTRTVNHLLHLTTSAAMILMAWGLGMVLPAIGPMLFFLLAGAWFAALAAQVSPIAGDRLTNAYYAVMMVAMAWMCAVMYGSVPGQIDRSSGRVPSGSVAMDVSAMHMSAKDMSGPRGGPAWIISVDRMAAVGFAVVALYWTCRYLAERRTHQVPQAARLTQLQPLHQAVTSAGTALMFGALA